MTEPSANGVDVDAGAEQVCGRGMANGMGADPFGCQQGHLDLGLVDVPFDQGVDAEACYGMPAAIEKDTCRCGAVRDQSSEFLNGARPQRALPLFATFAANGHRATRNI